MKFATLLFFFVFTHAFAGTCTPEVQAIFLDENAEMKPVKVSENHDRWTKIEKRMIRDAVASDGYWKDISISAAVEMFADKHEWSGGLPGSNAGWISYFELNGRRLAKVVYFPGDNEYGAIFQVGSRGYKMLSAVHDGDLSCQYE